MNFSIKSACTVLCLISAYIINAQSISGIVIDPDSKKPVPYATISVLNTKKGVTSDFNGKFQIEARINDTLFISCIGYHKIYEVVRSYDSMKILLPTHSYFLSEVKVLSEDEIPLMYKSVVFPGEEPGLAGAIVSPLSYWYYKLSKTEKSKRKVRNLMDYEKRMAKVMKIYNKELVKEYTGLNGLALDSCYIFCNYNIDLVENDTEFTIKYKLLKVLTDYNKSK